jgi:hypothetical protein
MATFVQRITASGNDVDCDTRAAAPNNFDSSRATVWWDNYNTNESKATQLRFTGVPIPAGSTINSATIDVVFDSGIEDNPSADIFAVDEDDASAATNASEAVAKPLTSASVAWVASGLGSAPSVVTSPDFAACVQEVVDRAGWASGNALVVVFQGRTSGGGVRYARARSADYDIANATTLAPQITIDYTAPAAGGPSGSPLTPPYLLGSPLQSPFLRA